MGGMCEFAATLCLLLLLISITASLRSMFSNLRKKKCVGIHIHQLLWHANASSSNAKSARRTHISAFRATSIIVTIVENNSCKYIIPSGNVDGSRLF